jgi:RND family efflux transporter MFP subunit
MNNPSDSAPGAPPIAKKQAVPWLLVVGAVIIFGIILAVAIVPRIQRAAVLDQAQKETRTTVPEVEVVRPKRVAASGLALPGNIQAIKETTVNARTTGYVARLYVDIGSRVKAGQVLAEIESPDVDQQLFQANAQTSQSRATVGQSQAQVSQQKAGVQQLQAVVAQQTAAVQGAQAQVASTQAKMTQSQAAEKQSEAQLASTRQALNVQQAGLKQAQAALELADVTNGRYQDLLKQGFVAQQDADQALATLKNSRAAVQSAQASVEAAQSNITSSQESVNATKAVVASAEADVEASRKNVSAVQGLLAASKANVQAGRAGVQASVQTVQANQAAVQSQMANSRRYAVLRSFERVVAPFDGVITARNVDVGTLISAGGSTTDSTSTAPTTGMFGVARTDEIRIQVGIPQTYVPALRAGSVATVTVQEMPGKRMRGAVSIRAGALDTASRTQLVEIHLPNPNNLLVPGMYAQVQIDPIHPPVGLQIPATALNINGKGTRVAFVTPDNKVHFQDVRIGRDLGATVEIVDGLKGGEKLVDNPTDALQEGTKVKILATHAGGSGKGKGGRKRGK